MNMTSKKLLKLLLKNGWKKKTQVGSHLKLEKPRLFRHCSSNAQQRLTKRITYELIKASGAKIKPYLRTYS